MRPLPRIYAISDLHLDTGPFEWPQAALEADVIVVAGDLANGVFDIDFLTQPNKPVVVVMGNHDFWDKKASRDMFDILAEAKAKTAGTQVHLLWDEAVVIGGVRFLGTTLWSSFGDFNENLVAAAWQHNRDYQYINAASWYANPENMAKHLPHAEQFTDFHGVNAATVGRFTPLIAYDLHQKSVAWLESEFNKAFSGPTVLVTHMAPSYESLRKSNAVPEHLLDQTDWELRGMDNTDLARIGAYASNLNWLFEQEWQALDLAIHGHLHDSLDYALGSTRVFANPRGRYQGPLTPSTTQRAEMFGVTVGEDAIAASQAKYRAYPYWGDNYDFEPSKVLRLEDGLSPTFLPAIEEVTPQLEALLEETRELLPYVGHEIAVLRRSVQEAAAARGDEFEKLLGEVVDAAVSAITRHGRSPGAQANPGLSRLGFDSPRYGARPYFGDHFEADPPALTLQNAISGMEQQLALLSRVPYAADEAHARVSKKALEVRDYLTRKGYDVELRGALIAPFWRAMPFNHGQIIIKTPGAPVKELALEVDELINGGRGPRKYIFWVREPDKS